MVQLDLLRNPGAVLPGKSHGAAAQPTERAAALEVWPKTGTQRQAVLEALLAAPHGLTDPEIAEHTGLYLYSAAPRRTELLQAGWVEDSGLRRDSGRGRNAIVWRPTIRALTRALTEQP